MSQAIKSFTQLNELMITIAKLPGVAAVVAPKVAARLSELAQVAFDSQTSVYGKPYAGNTDLVETGRLRAQAVKYVAVGTRVRAAVGAVPWARYQLRYGFMPLSGRLPVAWSDDIDRLITEELRRHFAAVGGR